jgi:hypothetical protein
MFPEPRNGATLVQYPGITNEFEDTPWAKGERARGRP